eukprot:scaffold361936_cov18-Prasinocladus_malaysianus.AAC.1
MVGRQLTLAVRVPRNTQKGIRCVLVQCSTAQVSHGMPAASSSRIDDQKDYSRIETWCLPSTRTRTTVAITVRVAI